MLEKTRGYPNEFEIWTWKCYSKKHIIRNKDKWHTAQDKDDDRYYCEGDEDEDDEDEDEDEDYDGSDGYDGYDGYDDQ